VRRLRWRVTVRNMARITIPDITVRTTSDGTGYPLGVVTGSGATAALALDALHRDASVMAEAQARLLETSAASLVDEGSWGVEVIDVRFAHGPTGHQDDGWLAFGTLRTTGLSPLIPPDLPYRG
jgi:hypothetical protein